MALKIKGIRLKTKKEKEVIYCPICKEPVYVNTADIEDDVQYESWHHLKKERGMMCEHCCCYFYILEYHFGSFLSVV